MNPIYPVCIPSKGRAENQQTSNEFIKLGVKHTVFIEEADREAYEAVLNPEWTQLHVVPHSNKGVTVTRNYIWDLMESEGHERYWTFDDNIKGLFRLNHNLRNPVADGTIMRIIERFAERYTNLPMCGMNYFMFAPRKTVMPPYYLNTRIYSNMLIETNALDSNGKPYRFETFFNEDTELSLRYLKDGYCLVLFNAFLIDKTTTMKMKGGNTDFYKDTQGRMEFVQELIDRHPDVTRLTRKWGRYHHHVDYSNFGQQLKRKPDVEVEGGENNFGMVWQEIRDGKWIDLDAEMAAEDDNDLNGFDAEKYAVINRYGKEGEE